MQTMKLILTRFDNLQPMSTTNTHNHSHFSLNQDPIKMFQPPLFYAQTPYNLQPDPYYYQHYYTEFNTYEQQQFSPYQEYNFRSDSILNSTSNEPVSSGAVVGSVNLDQWRLQQLSEIRILVQHAITQVEDLQLSLNKSSNRLDQIQFAMKQKTTQNLETKVELRPVIKAMKAAAPATLMVMTPVATFPEAENERMDENPEPKSDMKTTREVATPAQKATRTAAQATTKPAEKVNQVHDYFSIYYFNSGDINCVEIMFGRDECKVFDILLERNVKKFFENIVFIFDPGGGTIDIDHILEEPPPQSADTEISWKELFVKRELSTNCFMGWFFLDVLHGHTKAVRVVFMLQSSKLIFTGGYDSIIHMWDLEDGYFVSTSRPLGCTIRAIAADDGILIARGIDAYIQCWTSIERNTRNFDITDNAQVGNASALAKGYSGDLIFTSGKDGAIHMFDVGSCANHYESRKVASWKPHLGPVNSLSFEFPWLVSSSSDGRLSLINIRKLVRGCRGSKKSVKCAVEPPQRMLHGGVENLFSVAVAVNDAPALKKSGHWNCCS